MMEAVVSSVGFLLFKVVQDGLSLELSGNESLHGFCFEESSFSLQCVTVISAL